MRNNLIGKNLLAASLLTLTACSDATYLFQCALGHLEVTSRTRPIAEVLQDPGVPSAERDKLAKVMAIRSFATAELNLPDNDSYRSYADIGRPYVVWNVVATPEFSLVPRQWCYPVAGCVAYRGYFDEAKARTLAEELRSRGEDVDLYGVKAYSTLKWFDDPVLNTFLDGNVPQLAGLIFHELAHQVVYVEDDSSFNEAFAKTVEMEGVRRWLLGHASEQEWQEYLDQERRSEEFLTVLAEYREQLDTLYAKDLPELQKRVEKQRIIDRLVQALRERGKAWGNGAAVDSWLERGLNNARLASIATYRQQVPAFRALLSSLNGDLARFYLATQQLAGMPAAERTARLNQYGKGVNLARTDHLPPPVRHD